MKKYPINKSEGMLALATGLCLLLPGTARGGGLSGLIDKYNDKIRHGNIEYRKLRHGDEHNLSGGALDKAWNKHRHDLKHPPSTALQDFRKRWFRDNAALHKNLELGDKSGSALYFGKMSNLLREARQRGWALPPDVTYDPHSAHGYVKKHDNHHGYDAYQNNLIKQIRNLGSGARQGKKKHKH